MRNLKRGSIGIVAIMLSASTAADAGIAEQNIRDTANGALVPRTQLTVCDPRAFHRGALQSTGGLQGVATAGFGLASLAIVSAGVSMFTSRSHPDSLFASPCTTKDVVADTGRDALAGQMNALPPQGSPSPRATQ